MTGERPVIAFAIQQSTMHANGGVESITQVIARLREVRPVVLTNGDMPSTRRWRDLGIEVHEIAAASPGSRRLASYVRSNVAVAHVLRRVGARAVHCNDIRSFWSAGIAAQCLRLPIVLNIRDVKPPGERYPLHWRIAVSLADCTLSLSADMCDRLARRISPLPGARARHEHIPSIVDLASTEMRAHDKRASRETLGLPADRFVAVYVAAVCPKKAQLPFLQALAANLSRAPTNFHVVFVGDYHPDVDEYSAKCRRTVEEGGLRDRVSFVGFRPNIADYYAAADVSILASEREGLARCMIESIACGTPMVSFDVASAHEILSVGGAGRVVPHGSYVQLLEAVSELAADPAATKRLGERGAALAERLFHPAPVVSAYEGLYTRLVRERELLGGSRPWHWAELARERDA